MAEVNSNLQTVRVQVLTGKWKWRSGDHHLASSYKLHISKTHRLKKSKTNQTKQQLQTNEKKNSRIHWYVTEWARKMRNVLYFHLMRTIFLNCKHWLGMFFFTIVLMYRCLICIICNHSVFGIDQCAVKNWPECNTCMFYANVVPGAENCV